MAADLAGTPASGLRVQLCGDAHLSNFGAFASPERRLVFDVNDFDETLPGPFEWDVKRLAASLSVAGRDNGFPAKDRRGMPAEPEGSAARIFSPGTALNLVLGGPADQVAGRSTDDHGCQQRRREQPDDEPEAAADPHVLVRGDRRFHRP